MGSPCCQYDEEFFDGCFNLFIESIKDSYLAMKPSEIMSNCEENKGKKNGNSE